MNQARTSAQAQPLWQPLETRQQAQAPNVLSARQLRPSSQALPLQQLRMRQQKLRRMLLLLLLLQPQQQTAWQGFRQAQQQNMLRQQRQ
jgi:hypothetical protein